MWGEKTSIFLLIWTQWQYSLFGAWLCFGLRPTRYWHLCVVGIQVLALPRGSCKFFWLVGFSGRPFRIPSAYFSALEDLAPSSSSHFPPLKWPHSLDKLSECLNTSYSLWGPCNPPETSASLGIPVGWSAGCASVTSSCDCLVVLFPD